MTIENSYRSRAARLTFACRSFPRPGKVSLTFSRLGAGQDEAGVTRVPHLSSHTPSLTAKPDTPILRMPQTRALVYSVKHKPLNVRLYSLTFADRCLSTPLSIALANTSGLSNKKETIVTAVSSSRVEGSGLERHITIPWIKQATTVHNCKEKAWDVDC